MNAIHKSRLAMVGESVSTASREYLTFSVDEQLFGIDVLSVRDVLKDRKLAKIPLARAEVAGALNLRGRIITAIDMRRRLGLNRIEGISQHMNLVVSHSEELYSLVVDKVGDVLALPVNTLDSNPANMNPHWKEFSVGVFRLQGGLLIILDVDKLLSFVN
jgi:purine-binding chemotaxis protein CheW